MAHAAGLALLLAVALATRGQQPAPAFTSIVPFAFDTTGPVIRANAEAQKPFTVAGERGVLLGQQDGTFEAWILPVKLLSHLTIEADMDGYPVPIDVNQHAAAIEVRPDRTVITYSHVGFTVRQIMFSPSAAPPVTAPSVGPVVLFEFDCLRPTEFTFRFTPELRWMWPERNEGVPGVEWVPQTPAHASTGDESPAPGPGFYVLSTDYPDLAGAITIPGARPGIIAPYQERPQVHPVELKLHIEPARDRGRLFPLLMAVGANTASATHAALGARLAQLNSSIAAAYQAHAENYKKLLADSVSIETPDKTLNEAFQWAVVSIEQLRTRVQGTDETALVAGYYASADSARPGFGWFFGRDALYTLYAVNGYGDFALSRSELEFLINRQRADGKIMHEYSQTAAAIDWQEFPYMYAAADSTPLFLLALADYLRASGDSTFLTAHRDAVEKAWAFETSHTSDNGIYDNTQGTGWVEGWPGGLPHQEIYLALLDQQASAAYAYMERQLNDSSKAETAQHRAEAIAAAINSEFYDQQKSCYAFSRNTDGSLDRTSTVYPALAWWDPPSGKSILAHPDGCLSQFAASSLNTDWGLRDVANTEKIYDGMSYHQGSVWPLFTGWAALAEYRGNQPLAGYQILMENANLTRAEDLGAVTELLSGDFFIPFGRSTSHQLWSSAMVITPTLRGLFGISIDAQTKTITVDPHLPATWDHAEIKNLRLGNETADLNFTRAKGEITVSLRTAYQSWIKLLSTQVGAKSSPNGQLAIPRPAVEVGPFFQEPAPGDRTRSVRVLNEQYSEHKLTLTLEAPAGTEAQLPLVITNPTPKLRADGADLVANAATQQPAGLTAHASKGLHATPEPSALTVRFPSGPGWQTTTVTLTW
jgi:glycogen debranching enzyme